MSLRLQDTNVTLNQEASRTKQAANAKSSTRDQALSVCDGNLENRGRRVSKELDACRETIPERGEATNPRIKRQLDIEQLPADVENIDADDGGHLEFCHGYVRHIYEHLFNHEAEFHVKKDYLSQHEGLNPKMRMLLIQWLVSLQDRFKLLQDTLLVTISIMDRVLSTVSIKIHRANFQLLGATCLWIASKYEETCVPSVKDFVYMCADAYKLQEFREMEARILITLGFKFSRPISSHFLRRFSKAAGGDLKTHVAAKYLIELSLYDYSLVDRAPSLVAASALLVAGRLTGEIFWDRNMEYWTRYKAGALESVASRMARMAVNAAKEPYLSTTVEKYSSKKFFSIAKLFKAELLEDLLPATGTVQNGSK